MLLGAGTVLDGITARLAVDAGARFLVSPIVSPEMIEVGHRCGAAGLPGVQTATELERALSLRADAVKVFPAGDLGIGWFNAVQSVLPFAPLVPTGGIGLIAVTECLDARPTAVELVSALTGEG